MKMNDTAKTRLRTSAVTSHAPDRDINHSSNPPCTQVIVLSIGSAVIRLKYDNAEIRDADLLRLDEAIEKE